ncbi:unnamed protein product [Diatraea saccharalis]|uniref:Uncharacterized protein n=1 Tax=Diatraea saccharalis TaxID=40085 RepID=A0A9N9WG96_9NEOP|nr:unnamed protein product [Diatraea saccharalis]
MRAVWWSVAALALLAVTSALRTTQVEGAPKSSRRLPAPITSDSPTETSEPPDGKYTIKPRTSRRREDVPLREVRTRTRSKLTDRPNASSEAPKAIGRNERYDSRRTQSRSRSRNVNIEKNATVTNTERNIRNRNRQNVQITTTTSLPEVSSPIIDETKIEVINSNLQDLEKVSPSDDVIQSISRNNQFKRRSSTSSTIQTSDKLVPQRVRGRINTRPIARSLDLDGTTNAIIDPEKEITTARSVDLRNSRKLRYKTRLSETDSNLTGEGLKAQNNVIKSSQNEDNVASQPEMQVSAAGVVENSISQQSTESLPEKTVIKIKKGIRRPISSRGKINFKPSLESAKKPSDEISDDDNYPESFKALIQAKNASTQTSSPRGESLSVKASQKVYKTYTASSQSTNTGPGLNKYTRVMLHFSE